MLLTAASAIDFFIFFFNDTATTEIYTLSLHDALPIYVNFNDGKMAGVGESARRVIERILLEPRGLTGEAVALRSEEHTSELQSHLNLVCRLLLEKKKRHDDFHTERNKHLCYCRFQAYH